MSDIYHRGHEHRYGQRDDYRQNSKSSRWSPRDVDESDGHRHSEGTEMAGIVDRGGAFAEQQAGRCQHQLGGRNGGEGEPNPLAAAHCWRVRPGKNAGREIRDDLSEPHPQDPVDLTDLGPPCLALRTSSQVRVGQRLFVGGGLLVELRRQQLTYCCTVHM